MFDYACAGLEIVPYRVKPPWESAVAILSSLCEANVYNKGAIVVLQTAFVFVLLNSHNSVQH